MTHELGIDRNGCARTLTAPFPLTVELLQVEFRNLSAAELGRALTIGAWWWAHGQLPRHRSAGLLLRMDPSRATAAVERHAARFADGSALATMRAKEVAKVRRRLMFDGPPRLPGIVVPFPRTGPMV